MKSRVGNECAREVADKSSNERRHARLASRSTRRHNPLATELHRRFPEYSLDHPAGATSRQDGEWHSASAFVSPDPSVVPRPPVVFAPPPEHRPEQDAEARHTHRGAHIRCCTRRARYRLCQSGHGSAAEAGRGACKIRRGLHYPDEWCIASLQEPSGSQRDKGQGRRPRGARGGLATGRTRSPTTAHRPPHWRFASPEATRSSHHPRPTSASQDQRLGTCVARSLATEHENRHTPIASQQLQASCPPPTR